jgi:CSLREA domain-containing protein
MSISRNKRRILSTSVAVLGALAATFGVATQAQAATIKVTTTADELNNQPPCSLREAIRSANVDTAIGGCASGAGPDTITLPKGTIKFTIPNAATDADEDNGGTGDLDILADLTIRGAGAAKTVVDGNGPAIGDRVFHVGNAASVTFIGMTIRNGVETVGAVGGGGVGNRGKVTFSNAVVTGNSSGNGGGVSNVTGATATFVNTTVSGNTASGSGGGVRNGPGASSTFTGSTISGNSAQDGGGIFNSLGSASHLTNSTVSGNRANDSGGGFHGGTGSLSSVTVTANTADVDGNGLGNGGGVNADLTLTNTILAGNADASPPPQTAIPDCSGMMVSGGYNLIGRNTGCVITPTTGDKIGTPGIPLDPGLLPLRNNGGPTRTHALHGFSAAKNAGAQGAACPGTDQRGVPRPQGKRCEIGSYEYVTCLKGVVNRVGTPGKDALVGTKGRDVFLGLSGNDRFKGRGGGDRACGGGGKDTLVGGPGDDRLAGEGGSDLLSGGVGSDRCIGGPGRDRGISCERETGVP